MKRLISISLIYTILLTSCSVQSPTVTDTKPPIQESSPTFQVDDNQQAEEESLNFFSLSDPTLLSYIEDTLLAELEAIFQSDDYKIESITASYVSKEYLDELEANSKANIYYGYTLQEIEEYFSGTKYVFTIGERGDTVVQAFEDYDETFNLVVRNIAIGSGTILICVTASAISGGLGATTISTILAASAKTGASFALSSGTLSAVAAGAITGITTHDIEESLKSAALGGSESFMWGAITGEVIGGVSSAIALHRSAHTVRTPRESELAALETYKGTEQVSYLNGSEVPPNTYGATRPDVVRTVDGHLEAIEVKNYNLSSPSSRSTLYNELERQVSSRVANLPEGATQRVVLDVHARNFSDELVNEVISNIQARCEPFYPNLPIDIMN